MKNMPAMNLSRPHIDRHHRRHHDSLEGRPDGVSLYRSSTSAEPCQDQGRNACFSMPVARILLDPASILFDSTCSSPWGESALLPSRSLRATRAMFPFLTGISSCAVELGAAIANHPFPGTSRFCHVWAVLADKKVKQGARHMRPAYEGRSHRFHYLKPRLLEYTKLHVVDRKHQEATPKEALVSVFH